jgi:chloramphenicol 3-O-phosphotransferase
MSRVHSATVIAKTPSLSRAREGLLELASEAPPSSLARARFEELAKTWIHLATDLEHANSLLKRWGDAKLAKTG